MSVALSPQWRLSCDSFVNFEAGFPRKSHFGGQKQVRARGDSNTRPTDCYSVERTGFK